MKKLTKKEIENNCKRSYLKDAEKYFKTRDFKTWVEKCILLAKENGVYELKELAGDKLK